MQSLRWLVENGFNLFNALGVIGSLLLTGHSLRSETKTRKVANLLTLTGNHREVWAAMIHEPSLKRVLSPNPDLTKSPVTRDEEIFVTLVIQHLSMVFHAMRDELTINPEGLRRDVWQFFSLPIPSAIWDRLKVMQNDDFVAYVEACRNWK